MNVTPVGARAQVGLLRTTASRSPAMPEPSWASTGARCRKMHDMYLFEVKKASESKRPSDYCKLIATVPGEQGFRPMDQGNCPMVAKKN